MTAGANSGLHPDQEFFLEPKRPPKLAVCIPACNEESLIPVIQNLMDCVQIENLLVCVVINASEDATEACRRQNVLTFETLVAFLQSQNPEFSIHVALYNAIPAKKSGVGMARKLAMDKACSLSESTNSDTVLLCLDADCQVEENYLKAVAGYFAVRKNVLAASVYFEHPLPQDHQLRESITSYELHLRYLKNALQWAGYPWYFHTVGSSMAVRARTYLASGGMNTRKAGEDFYFLHKLMPLGFGEINTTTVFPEARYSDRVPFGTGKSMLELRNGASQLTYNFQSFQVLQQFFSQLNTAGEYTQSIELHPLLKTYFNAEGLTDVWHSSLANTRTLEKALERFYSWFSGFRIIHCLHYLRDGGFPDQAVVPESGLLLHALGLEITGDSLKQFRELDKTNNPAIAGSS